MAHDARAFQSDVIKRISATLKDSSNSRPLAVMICGIAGSGKTTLSKAIAETLPLFTRISVDEIVFSMHGIYGVDYLADKQLYDTYLKEADRLFLQKVENSLQEKRHMILERSFWARSTREEIKAMVEKHGGGWLLFYLKMNDKEEVWKRICDRKRGEKTADSAFDITREIFDTYWTGFESPIEEDEIVLENWS